MPPHHYWLSPPRAHAIHVLEHTNHYIFVAQVTNPLKATVRAPLFILLCCCLRPTLRPSLPTPTLYKFSTIHSPPLLLFFCITVGRTDSGNRSKTEIAEPISPCCTLLTVISDLHSAFSVTLKGKNVPTSDTVHGCRSGHCVQAVSSQQFTLRVASGVV